MLGYVPSPFHCSLATEHSHDPSMQSMEAHIPITQFNILPGEKDP